MILSWAAKCERPVVVGGAPAPVRVPSQWPLARVSRQSFLLVNDKGDNGVKDVICEGQNSAMNCHARDNNNNNNNNYYYYYYYPRKLFFLWFNEFLSLHDSAL